MEARSLGLGGLFWSSRDALIVVEAIGERITLWNPAAEALFGYPAAEACELTLPALVVEHLRSPLADELSRIRAGGRTGMSQPQPPIDLVSLGKYGEQCAIELSVTSLGESLADEWHLLVVVRDASDRARRDTLLRVARRFAVESDAEQVLSVLLDEAVALLQADAGVVYDWDSEAGALVASHITEGLRNRSGPQKIRPGQGAAGQAVERQAAVIVNDYQQDSAAIGMGITVGTQAVVAAPLLHEGRLLGAIGVGSYRPGKRFNAVDASLLEILSGLAAAALIGVERSRLEGALLAARTAQHSLSNQLALTVGYSELLSIDPRLPDDLRRMANEALRGAQESAVTVQLLQRITRLEETDFGVPGGSVLDLPRSSS